MARVGVERRVDRRRQPAQLLALQGPVGGQERRRALRVDAFQAPGRLLGRRPGIRLPPLREGLRDNAGQLRRGAHRRVLVGPAGDGRVGSGVRRFGGIVKCAVRIVVIRVVAEGLVGQRLVGGVLGPVAGADKRELKRSYNPVKKELKKVITGLKRG